MSRSRQPWLFLAPYLAVFALFWAWPILYSLWVSLMDTRRLPWTFHPSANWGRLAHDPAFWTALGNTLLVLAVQVPAMIALATLLALALDSPRLRAKPLFRFAFFAPVVVGAVAYSAVFRLLFNTEFGAVNAALGVLGAAPVEWLTRPQPALVALMLALTWRWTGYNAVILLAGLQGIPGDLYEAARLDGASPAQVFARITLPLLRPVLLFVTVLSVIGTLQLFTEPFLITGGGPGNATTTLGVYLYLQGFRSFNFGYASAVAYSVALLAGLFSLVQFRLFGREP